MAYCKSCGAYIPDGLTACLACGYDENAEKPAAGGSKTAAKTEQNEEMREILERHRKLQQEKNKQWAESEKARREQQAENRRWAQEEYAKRQAQRKVEAEQVKREEEKHRREQQTFTGTGNRTSTGTGNQALAALSYLDILFTLPFLLTPNDEYARFHAKQGIRLFLFTLVTRVLKYFTPFGWVFTLLHLYFIYKGMTNALNGKKEPLPYIGTMGSQNT